MDRTGCTCTRTIWCTVEVINRLMRRLIRFFIWYVWCSWLGYWLVRERWRVQTHHFQYYTSKPFLFAMCAGNEAFYYFVYLSYFTHGPTLFGLSINQNRLINQSTFRIWSLQILHHALIARGTPQGRHLASTFGVRRSTHR